MMKFQSLLHLWGRRQLSAYLDGRLSAREGRRLESHLEECNSCRLGLQELRAVQATLQALKKIDSAADTPLLPWTAIETKLGSSPAPVPVFARYRLAIASATVAALVLVVALGFYLSTPREPAEIMARKVEPAELYQYAADRLIAPEKILVGDTVMIGPELEEMIPKGSAFYEGKLL